MARSLSIVAMLMAFAAVLAACRTVPASVDAAAALPSLHLAPAALAGGLALQQRLTFVREGRRDTIDALVEVDAAEVRVVAHAQGQVALRFTWNGETLTQVRDERLPAAVQAARVSPPRSRPGGRSTARRRIACSGTVTCPRPCWR